jgi:two-component system nitrogen regulation response regulator GlnG
MAKGDTILPTDLPPEIRGQPRAPEAPSSAGPGPSPAAGDPQELAAALFRWARARADLKVLPAVERELIRCALEDTHGNQVQAAKLLGITRATLRKRIDKFAIRREFSTA